MSKPEAMLAMNLAIGRLLRIMWTPSDVPGDHSEQYDDCRRVVMECSEALGVGYELPQDYAAGHDKCGRRKGAQGEA